MMSDSSTELRSLRERFERYQVDWVFWAMDLAGVFQIHEGPGVRWKGVEPGECVGQCAYDLHRENPKAVRFTQIVMHRPSTDYLVFNGHRFLVSGAPTREGGAVGVALAVRPVDADDAEVSDADYTVTELMRPVPEIGARAGDLLFLDEEEPSRVGVFSRMRPSDLSPETQRALARIRQDAFRDAPIHVKAPYLRLLS